jgi:hypothetical protein
MNPNILYNTVTAAGFLPMLATEGVKSVCAAFGVTIKGKWSLLTFIVVWALMNIYAWVPTPPSFGTVPTVNNLWYLIQSACHFLAAIGVYNFARRLINAIEGTKNKTAAEK